MGLLRPVIRCDRKAIASGSVVRQSAGELRHEKGSEHEPGNYPLSRHPDPHKDGPAISVAQTLS